MRKRKHADNEIRCYKFHCWLKDHDNHFPLPDVLYKAAKKQQALWNVLVTGQDRRYEGWKDTHAPTSLPNPKTGDLIKKYLKPDRTYWDDFDKWARQAVADSGLNWEMGPEILDRYYSAHRRLKKGGGMPRLQRGLDHFSLAHRYTGGGANLKNLSGERQRRFRIIWPNATAYTDNRRDSRRQRLTSAWFLIDDERIALAVILHRAIPAEAIVKRVALSGWKQSPTMHWQFALVFTVEEQPKEKCEAAMECVGLDVGWRKIGERLRVAVAYDGRRHEELYIPLTYMAQGLGEVSLERKRSAQQVKDGLLERAKTELRGKLPALRIELPSNFTQMRVGGLIRLMQEWQSSGAQHDALAILQRWKHDNDQLARKALLIENRMRSRREHIYRNFAAHLAKAYRLIRIERLDLGQMSRRTNIKSDHALKAATEYRRYAACGELLSAIRNAGKGRVSEIEASYTTSICAQCGKRFEAGEKLIGTCVNGHQRDQDWNAAENIYLNRSNIQLEHDESATRV